MGRGYPFSIGVWSGEGAVPLLRKFLMSFCAFWVVLFTVLHAKMVPLVFQNYNLLLPAHTQR